MAHGGNTKMKVLSDILWDESGRLDTLLPKIDSAVAKAIDRALKGEELGFDDGLLLARTRGAEMEALVLAADHIRRVRVGDVITYVVNRNINFTNICFIGCRFCAFSRAPREKDAYFHSFEEIGRRSLEAWERGAREVCVQGGLPRELDPFYYRDLLMESKQATPSLHLTPLIP